MRGEACSWKNVACQFDDQFPLPIRCFGEQHSHQLFQCNHTNLQLYQFSICERGSIGIRFNQM